MTDILVGEVGASYKFVAPGPQSRQIINKHLCNLWIVNC
jgi:hypothetical protein